MNDSTLSAVLRYGECLFVDITAELEENVAGGQGYSALRARQNLEGRCPPWFLSELCNSYPPVPLSPPQRHPAQQMGGVGGGFSSPSPAVHYMKGPSIGAGNQSIYPQKYFQMAGVDGGSFTYSQASGGGITDSFAFTTTATTPTGGIGSGSLASTFNGSRLQRMASNNNNNIINYINDGDAAMASGGGGFGRIPSSVTQHPQLPFGYNSGTNSGKVLKTNSITGAATRSHATSISSQNAHMIQHGMEADGSAFLPGASSTYSSATWWATAAMSSRTFLTPANTASGPNFANNGSIVVTNNTINNSFVSFDGSSYVLHPHHHLLLQPRRMRAMGFCVSERPFAAPRASPLIGWYAQDAPVFVGAPERVEDCRHRLWGILCMDGGSKQKVPTTKTIKWAIEVLSAERLGQQRRRTGSSPSPSSPSSSSLTSGALTLREVVAGSRVAYRLPNRPRNVNSVFEEGGAPAGGENQNQCCAAGGAPTSGRSVPAGLEDADDDDDDDEPLSGRREPDAGCYTDSPSLNPMSSQSSSDRAFQAPPVAQTTNPRMCEEGSGPPSGPLGVAPAEEDDDGFVDIASDVLQLGITLPSLVKKSEERKEQSSEQKSQKEEISKNSFSIDEKKPTNTCADATPSGKTSRSTTLLSPAARAQALQPTPPMLPAPEPEAPPAAPLTRHTLPSAEELSTEDGYEALVRCFCKHVRLTSANAAGFDHITRPDSLGGSIVLFTRYLQALAEEVARGFVACGWRGNNFDPLLVKSKGQCGSATEKGNRDEDEDSELPDANLTWSAIYGAANGGFSAADGSVAAPPLPEALVALRANSFNLFYALQACLQIVKTTCDSIRPPGVYGSRGGHGHGYGGPAADDPRNQMLSNYRRHIIATLGFDVVAVPPHTYLEALDWSVAACPPRPYAQLLEDDRAAASKKKSNANNNNNTNINGGLSTNSPSSSRHPIIVPLDPTWNDMAGFDVLEETRAAVSSGSLAAAEATDKWGRTAYAILKAEASRAVDVLLQHTAAMDTVQSMAWVSGSALIATVFRLFPNKFTPSVVDAYLHNLEIRYGEHVARCVSVAHVVLSHHAAEGTTAELSW